jgi:DNA polymerase IIIc chi subunit
LNQRVRLMGLLWQYQQEEWIDHGKQRTKSKAQWQA